MGELCFPWHRRRRNTFSFEGSCSRAGAVAGRRPGRAVLPVATWNRLASAAADQAMNFHVCVSHRVQVFLIHLQHGYNQAGKGKGGKLPFGAPAFWEERAENAEQQPYVLKIKNAKSLTTRTGDDAAAVLLLQYLIFKGIWVFSLLPVACTWHQFCHPGWTKLDPWSLASLRVSVQSVSVLV